MARAFEDLLVGEADGRPRLTFRSRAGQAVLEDVSVELASEVLRPGEDGAPILQLDGGTY